MPADYDSFVTKIGSKVRVETHTFMSNLPRLRLFKGYSPGVRLTNTPYKRFVELGEGTHSIVWEKNRYELFEVVQQFLAEEYSQDR